MHYLRKGDFMRERENQLTVSTKEKRLLDANEVCVYLSLGRNKGIEFAKNIGAEVKIGRRSLYDKSKIDKYLDEGARAV
jgi:predicted DNA-binding transcriptional regulator AlpA